MNQFPTRDGVAIFLDRTPDNVLSTRVSDFFRGGGAKRSRLSDGVEHSTARECDSDMIEATNSDEI